MTCLDFTAPDPAGNLACDEALLDRCEVDPEAEVLRFWESPTYFVVVGYSNHVDAEVNRAACATAGVPIFRRCSGGGTVVQGPGCLSYSVILRIDGNAALRNITSTNCHVMTKHCEAFSSLLGREVKMQGHTDLTVGGLKFSGNAQRRKQHALIFHGTVLLHFDLGLLERLLPMPSRQPDYRDNRAHAGFVNNLAIFAEKVKQALREAWSASETSNIIPDYQKLAAEKYASAEWNFKF